MATAGPDRWGAPVQVADGSPHPDVNLFGDAVDDLVTLSGNPVERARQAGADGRLVLARVLSAYLALYSTSRTGAREATAILEDLDGVDGETGERELLHLRAARAWAGGEWERAALALERALLHNPRDLLALKVAQDLYFFLGNRLDLRDVVARALPAWAPGSLGWGYVQGMYAFGLEENAQYAEAEQRGRTALAEDARDVWAVHALAHVHEMRGEQEAGIEFLVRTTDNWKDSYFAVHNWWHRALYHLDLGQIDDVLALYDGPIRSAHSLEWLDLVDAAALLWRLALFGVDVHARARQLSKDLAPLIDQPWYVFNDWHAAMAFGLAGDPGVGEALIAANRAHASGTNRRAVDGAGLDLLRGFVAFARGDASAAIDQLIDVRSRAHVIGGSHAQRDVIDLTLLAAAAQAGESALVTALTAERHARKPSAASAVQRLVAANKAGSPTSRRHEPPSVAAAVGSDARS